MGFNCTICKQDLSWYETAWYRYTVRNSLSSVIHKVSYLRLLLLHCYWRLFNSDGSKSIYIKYIQALSVSWTLALICIQSAKTKVYIQFVWIRFFKYLECT